MNYISPITNKQTITLLNPDPFILEIVSSNNVMDYIIVKAFSKVRDQMYRLRSGQGGKTYTVYQKAHIKYGKSYACDQIFNRRLQSNACYTIIEILQNSQLS